MALLVKVLFIINKLKIHCVKEIEFSQKYNHWIRIYREASTWHFFKWGVLKNSANFTEKHLCQSLYFNNVMKVILIKVLKKRLWHRCFPVNFATISRTLFLKNTSGGCFCNTQVFLCYHIPEVYSEPCLTCKTERFAKILNLRTRIIDFFIFKGICQPHVVTLSFPTCQWF